MIPYVICSSAAEEENRNIFYPHIELVSICHILKQASGQDASHEGSAVYKDWRLEAGVIIHEHYAEIHMMSTHSLSSHRAHTAVDLTLRLTCKSQKEQIGFDCCQICLPEICLCEDWAQQNEH